MKNDGDGGGQADLGGAEDLLASARRGELGAPERQELERALDIDPTLRIAHQVGRDFDRIATVRAGDDALIARVTGRVLATRALAGRRRGDRRVALAIAAALVLAASGAAAWWAASSAGRLETDSPIARARVAGAARSAARRTAPVAGQPIAEDPQEREAAEAPAPGDAPTPANAGAALALAPLIPAAPSPSHVAPPPSARPPGAAARASARHAPDARSVAGSGGARSIEPSREPSRSSAAGPTSAPAPSEPTAATLFHDANAARRAGDLASARALYRQVESRFPASSEARLSLVSLGKLLLGAGEVGPAEQEFARYLMAGDGPLVEEALVGRAQCFERLGRPADERRVWQRLLRDFPSSVYAARARQRVEAATTAP